MVSAATAATGATVSLVEVTRRRAPGNAPTADQPDGADTTVSTPQAAARADRRKSAGTLPVLFATLRCVVFAVAFLAYSIPGEETPLSTSLVVMVGVFSALGLVAELWAAVTCTVKRDYRSAGLGYITLVISLVPLALYLAAASWT